MRPPCMGAWADPNVRDHAGRGKIDLGTSQISPFDLAKQFSWVYLFSILVSSYSKLDRSVTIEKFLPKPRRCGGGLPQQ